MLGFTIGMGIGFVAGVSIIPAALVYAFLVSSRDAMRTAGDLTPKEPETGAQADEGQVGLRWAHSVEAVVGDATYGRNPQTLPPTKVGGLRGRYE